jgi:magnesium-protoporphyrin O-methyltransferase
VSATKSAPTAAANAGNDKAIVKDYFNTTGFDRWRRIYGDGEVNKVQRDIREGHQRTVDTVLYWFKSAGAIAGQTVCDAGCGVGSLSIPLAQQGAVVFGSDIAEKMIGEAQDRAAALGLTEGLTFEAKELQAIDGSYDTVVCLDVLIHYPDEDVEAMLAHLASLAKSRLILSFAPKAGVYVLLKRIGELFPGPSKTTRAYLHPVREVVAILRRLGWEVRRKEFIGSQFYFSQVIEAVPIQED